MARRAVLITLQLGLLLLALLVPQQAYAAPTAAASQPASSASPVNLNTLQSVVSLLVVSLSSLLLQLYF